MISLGRVAGTDYYARLHAEDYYFQGRHNQGYWQGTGAEVLGLSGPVSPETLARLLDGFSPDGTQALVRNAGSEKRCRGWDVCASASKSLSVLWSQADPATRERLEYVHRQAVDETIHYLEDTAASVRTGTGGTEMHRAKLIVAVFPHHTSREREPHLHSHAVVINIGLHDGQAHALFSPELYAQKMTAGSLYRAALSRHLQQDLGLELERRDGDFYDIKGVPQDLMTAFSSRREAIETMLTERAWSSARAAATVTLATRPRKREEAQESLLARWHVVGSEYGFGMPEAARLVQAAPSCAAPSWNAAAQDEMFRALRSRLARQPAFSAKEVVRALALEAPAYALDRSAIEALAATFLSADDVYQYAPSRSVLYALSEEDILLDRSASLAQDQDLEWEL